MQNIQNFYREEDDENPSKEATRLGQASKIWPTRQVFQVLTFKLGDFHSVGVIHDANHEPKLENAHVQLFG